VAGRIVQVIVDIEVDSEEEELRIIQDIESTLSDRLVSGITLKDVTNFYKEN